MIQYKKGDKFGELIFLEEITPILKPRKAVFKCSCGKQFITRISGVKAKKVLSCGCIKIEKLKNRMITHNMSNSSEYSSWESMKSRVLNPKNKHYKNYGGRGIKICENWLNSFESFFKDMGIKPNKKYSLERIDVNGDYEPSNCRWTSRYIQDRNKRNNIHICYNNENFILTDLAKKVNMHPQTLKARLARGLPIEEAILKNFKYTKK